MMRIGCVVREMVEELLPLLGEHALPCTEKILCHQFNCSRSALYLTADRTIDEAGLQQLSAIVERCRNHEPLDYILGVTYFFNREFIVTPAVLLPRPDTELLVEQVLRHERASPLCFAEVGIGSGIISCILTEQQTGWNAVGIDISAEALSVARRNRRSERVGLVCSDFFTAVATRQCFDFIVSNPPYITTGDIAHLDISVSRFEPYIAIDGGADGLDFYRRFALQAPGHLKTGGTLYCEIGYDQEDTVRSIFSTAPWGEIHCYPDIAGHPRVLRVRCGE
jgi:release factor glutamine methyltransferase